MTYKNTLVKYAKRQLQGRGFMKINSPMNGEKLSLCLEKIAEEVDKILSSERKENYDPISLVKELVSPYIPYSHFKNPLEAKTIVNQYSKSGIPREEIEKIIENSKYLEELKTKLNGLDIHYGVEKMMKENQKFPHPRYIPTEEVDPEQISLDRRVERHNKFRRLENLGLLWAGK